MKIHKGDDQTRPVVSCPGSLLEGIGIWLCKYLQPLAEEQDSYLKDSKELIKMLFALKLPPNAVLFTSDAVSMYTNIITRIAIRDIACYLRSIAY